MSQRLNPSASICSASICSAPGCDRPRCARGLCRRHYDAWRATNRCTVPGCTRVATEADVCATHAEQRRLEAEAPADGYVTGCGLCDLRADALRLFSSYVGRDYCGTVIAARTYEAAAHCHGADGFIKEAVGAEGASR